MTLLAEVADDRDNNLNLIRMLAAFGVLVSHAYPITLGPKATQPLETLTGMTLGQISVFVFFVISGFLITRSFDRSSTVLSWFTARALRIFPGLFLVLVLTTLILGPSVTSLPTGDYFSDPDTRSYLWRNLSLYDLQYALPGVFEANPYGPAINGSLWTLIHEVLCYAGVLLAGLLGLVGSRLRLTAGLAAYLAIYMVLTYTDLGSLLPGKAQTFLKLTFPFAVGMAFYAWREKLSLRWWIGVIVALLAALLRDTPLFQTAFVLALSYWIFLLGYLPRGIVRRYNELGDYSYGTYIYAFPAQQLMVWSLGPMSPGMNIALATPLTLAMAILSWWLVEQPSLRSKRAVVTSLEVLLFRLRRRHLGKGNADK